MCHTAADAETRLMFEQIVIGRVQVDKLLLMSLG